MIAKGHQVTSYRKMIDGQLTQVQQPSGYDHGDSRDAANSGRRCGRHRCLENDRGQQAFLVRQFHIEVLPLCIDNAVAESRVRAAQVNNRAPVRGPVADVLLPTVVN